MRRLLIGDHSQLPPFETDRIAGFIADQTEVKLASARLLRSRPDFRATHAEEAFPPRSSELRNQMIAALREAGLPGYPF